MQSGCFGSFCRVTGPGTTRKHESCAGELGPAGLSIGGGYCLFLYILFITGLVLRVSALFVV